MKLLAWLLSLFFAFNLGAEKGNAPKASDQELRERVQEHLDVIADESAAILDEVTEELRNDPAVKNGDQFAQDVREVARETLTDLNRVAEDTKRRVEEKFGPADAPAQDAVDGAPLPEEPAPDAEGPTADSEGVPALEEDAVDAEPLPEEKPAPAAEEPAPAAEEPAGDPDGAPVTEKDAVDAEPLPEEKPAPAAEEPVNG